MISILKKIIFYKEFTKIRTGINSYTVINYMSVFGIKILISIKDNVIFPPEHINCRCQTTPIPSSNNFKLMRGINV